MYLPYVTHFSPFLTFSLLLSTLLSSTFLSNPTLMMTWTLSGLQFPRPAVTRKEELSLVKYQSLNASHGQPVVPLCLSAVNGVVLTTPPVHSSCNNRLFFIVKLTAEHFAKKCLIKMQHRLSFSFFLYEDASRATIFPAFRFLRCFGNDLTTCVWKALKRQVFSRLWLFWYSEQLPFFSALSKGESPRTDVRLQLISTWRQRLKDPWPRAAG